MRKRIGALRGWLLIGQALAIFLAINSLSTYTMLSRTAAAPARQVERASGARIQYAVERVDVVETAGMNPDMWPLRRNLIVSGTAAVALLAILLAVGMWWRPEEETWDWNDLGR